MGQHTDAPEDNLLGISDKQELNEQEALGVAMAERYLVEELDYPVEVSVALLLDLHRRIFGRLYEWAGQWRRTVPNVGAYLPPAAVRVPQLLYEFTDELHHRQKMLSATPTVAEIAELLAYEHHRFVAIHPFTNGNGRTARLLTNLLAYQYFYQEVVLYERAPGAGRTDYLQAIRQADAHDLSGLRQLVSAQLRPLARP